jgi:hypothetical protein
LSSPARTRILKKPMLCSRRHLLSLAVLAATWVMAAGHGCKEDPEPSDSGTVDSGGIDVGPRSTTAYLTVLSLSMTRYESIEYTIEVPEAWKIDTVERWGPHDHQVTVWIPVALHNSADTTTAGTGISATPTGNFHIEGPLTEEEIIVSIAPGPATMSVEYDGVVDGLDHLGSRLRTETEVTCEDGYDRTFWGQILVLYVNPDGTQAIIW